MVLEWDERKARMNLQKHGVSFPEASTCLEDPDILMYHDVTHSKNEDRYVAIAKSSQGRILVTVLTIRRDPNGKKIYRIISARQASKREKKIYPRK